jgi:hypothetical protein
LVGDTAASSYLTEPGSKKKAIIRKAPAEDGRTKVEHWTPRYVVFPRPDTRNTPWRQQRRR